MKIHIARFCTADVNNNTNMSNGELLIRQGSKLNPNTPSMLVTTIYPVVPDNAYVYLNTPRLFGLTDDVTLNSYCDTPRLVIYGTSGAPSSLRLGACF